MVATSASSIENTPRLGLCLVISAPSGAGKSTLVERLRAEFPHFAYSISCTTRAPRGQEKDGVDYHFLTREEFLSRRDAGYFAEWAEVHGNLYGTPKAPVEEHLASGRDVLFDIDVQGALQVKKVFPQGLFVFIQPPSRQELERRLRGRGTDSEEAIAKRLGNALGELSQSGQFDYLIVNDDLDTAADELRAIYVAGRTRTINRPGLLDALLAQWEAK
ncbi:MAG: guanylate kinase [Humidesulfovibrio sp.]|uniref:guanylate kinase n=1 Tax=Humidesulfovibrio sp. TaxID=2910988 RepID=UPI0027E66B78|nr:guanylate kinase [Humidesulfovibrio sp.]MDQ7834142.1 guanylate kinase [Humidesulfovibrio sp.]